VPETENGRKLKQQQKTKKGQMKISEVTVAAKKPCSE